MSDGDHFDHDKQSAELQRSLADAKAEIAHLKANNRYQAGYSAGQKEYADKISRLAECVKAADEIRKWLPSWGENTTEYDEARKLVTI